MLAARVPLTSLTKPLWCQAVTHTSTGCLSSCSNGQALTPFHVNEDSPVTDKKKNSGWPLRRGKRHSKNSTSPQKERLIICDNGTPVALREKITGKSRSEISF